MWLVGLVGILAGVVAGLSIRRSDTARCRKIILVDSNGHERAILQLSKNGPQLVFQDASGSNRTEITESGLAVFQIGSLALRPHTTEDGGAALMLTAAKAANTRPQLGCPGWCHDWGSELEGHSNDECDGQGQSVAGGGDPSVAGASSGSIALRANDTAADLRSEVLRLCGFDDGCPPIYGDRHPRKRTNGVAEWPGRSASRSSTHSIRIRHQW